MSDALFVAIIALMIVAASALVWFFFGRMMRKAAANWEPNTRLVQGTFSRWRVKLNGVYQDHPVTAFLAKEGDENNQSYGYVARMTVAPGFENWSASYVVGRKDAPS